MYANYIPSYVKWLHCERIQDRLAIQVLMGA